MKTNWKTKLKTVLEKDEFSEVSLKKELTKADKTQLNLVLSAFVSDNLVDTSQKKCELTEIKSSELCAFLNQFIEAGISFEVSADDFQIIDNGQILKTSDKEFLQINRQAILCQLQNALLMRHLFSIAPEQFEDFACSITERESIMAMNNADSFPSYREAVKDVSKNWFSYLCA